jgi:predicted RNA-binding Zn ribbon-like protein
MRETPGAHRRIRFGGTRTPGGYAFELTGGRLCLDLANTKDERATDQPRELLLCYDDVVQWAVQAGAVTAGEGRRLRRWAAEQPQLTSAALARLVSAREALFEILSAAAGHRQAGRATLGAFNVLVAEARARQHLAWVPGGFQWRWRPPDEPDLDRPLWASVLSAVDLVTSPDLARLRRCEGQGCAWLFLDTSRNASRRWCDMSVCGNRAKARRHRNRQAAVCRS